MRLPWPKKRPPEDDAAASTRVLLVCAGNICRSPTALAVLRHKLKARGLQSRIAADAAGTHGYHVGEAPDARAIRHAAARGYDLSALRARRIVAEDFERFDWVLGMDRDNLARLHALARPGARAQIGLLMQFATRRDAGDEVPDPYYGPPAGFERVLDLVEDACEGLLARLEAEGAGNFPLKA